MASSTNKEAKMITEPRRLKPAHYKRGKFSRRIKHPGPKLPSSWKLLRNGINTIATNKRVFAGILLVYAILSFILVTGLSGAGIAQTKATIEADGSFSAIDKGFTLLGSLFTNGGSAGAASSTYQTIILIIVSLVVIWVLRQAYASETFKRIKVKDAFYKSTGQLIPFLLVLLVISLQLIPFIIGSSLYSLILTNGLAVTGIEKLTWGLMFFLLALWTLYMLTASIFAMYIVTLPDVMPRQALRSAKQLVQYRRWTIMRKLVFLPVALLLIISILMLPILIWLTPAAEPVFFIISLASLIVVHSYIYGLYRELL